MKLDCHIVRDLLPLYVEGLCEEKTLDDVRKHLSECPDCQAIYESFQEEEHVEINTSVKELNPFLKIKKLQTHRIILTFVLTLCLSIGSIMIYNDYQGSEDQMIRQVNKVMESKDFPAIYYVTKRTGLFWGRRGNQSHIELYANYDNNYRLVFSGSNGQEVDSVYVMKMHLETVIISANKPRVSKICIYGSENDELKEEIFIDPDHPIYRIVDGQIFKFYNEKGQEVPYFEDEFY